jgi:uncharacterized protein with PIN domain
MLDVATKLRLGLVVEPEEAAAEIERLRGLLREFWECADSDTEYWETAGGYHKELRKRVREALGDEGE